MTAARHLAHLLRGRWFRRLFAVRITSQLGDGVFQVALASYVIFSPERQATPGGIAAALAVVLLPFSVLGPFVGVFLDRWSRRQVLAIANLVRAALVLLVALVVGGGGPGPLVLVLALACLSVNRFLLAGLSASLPHVVERDDLVMANAVTPTSGTLAALAGFGVGSAGRVLAQSQGVGANGADVLVLLWAALLFVAGALLALRIPRPMLGPDFDPARPAVREAARHVLAGLEQGLVHLGRRRRAAHGLATIAAHRFFFGISTVMLILLYRGYFHDPAEPDAAFAGLAVAVVVSGTGFVAAAFLTPVVTERFSLRAWITFLLGAAALTQLFPASLFTEPALLVAAFFLGLASQGIKICVDTLVQTAIDDAFRGRVFALYDVVFNVTFVAAAGVAALTLPTDGRSHIVLAGLSVGYLLTGAIFGWTSRPRTTTAGVHSPEPGRVP